MTLLPARPNKSLVGRRMHVSVLIDESTSMKRIQSTVMQSFNDYLDTLREQPAEVRASVGKFSNTFEPLSSGLPLMQVPHLTRETYAPDGNTALYDAMGTAMQTLDAQLGENDRALLVTVTDGEDNISVDFDEERVTAMVHERKKTGRWTFIFIGPDRGLAQRLGIENQLQLGAGSTGFATAMAQLAEATTQLLLTDGR